MEKGTISNKDIKTMIKDIYAKKKQYEKKSEKIVSLKAFIELYFKNRYGLKNLSFNIKKNFIRSLERKDIDCMIFKLILNSQLDEGYHKINEEIKNSFRKIFEEIHKKTNVLLNPSKIEFSLKKIKLNKIPLKLKDVNEIMVRMLGKDKTAFQTSFAKDLQKGVKYSQFINSICFFFLDKHKSFLKNSSKIFIKF